ncbi:unnamed protein product [Paramecium primaurelia]|uniref:EGF-like domain-containing protein n=1 Tax=Paramecium primaurelia TaxID=5886 RepID=A0A8S1P8H7_PARPR|nr:unnamed protein product [Paramecium primaurelia]
MSILYRKKISFRVFNSGFCQCLPGYYDDGISFNCKNCQIQCLTCQNTADYCTTCITTRYLEGNICKCDQIFFDNKLEKCSKCDQNCYYCTIDLKNCIECDQSQMRLLDNVTQTCICKPGTTDINFEYQICDITCQTCQNSITNCTSCKILRLLFNNQYSYIAQMIKSVYFVIKLFLHVSTEMIIVDQNRIFKTGNMCICQDGYYEESITLSCKQCDQSCLTCKISPTYCLTCDASYYQQQQNQIFLCSEWKVFKLLIKSQFGCLEQMFLFKRFLFNTFKIYFDPDAQMDIMKLIQKNVHVKLQIILRMRFKLVLNNNNQCNCLDGYYYIGIEMCQLCNLYCNTCYMSSTKCAQCNLTKFFRLLNLNQFFCQNGYYDNGLIICEKRSNQCLACKGKGDYCTSCDPNQNRIDQSVINKCPCSSGFYQDEYENCQRCYLKCQTCNQSKENCINCSYSITSNRQSISQNCICKDGQFDDGIQLDCQKCSTRCKYCLESSTHCLTCFSNLRDTPPICNCKLGFFEKSAQNCEQCENQCLTFEKTPTNCLICKVECDFFQCKICKDSSLNCIICKGDSINIPKCECPEGFQDDLKNESCQVCDGLCKTCNVDGCLSCNSNKILPPEMSCDQPPNSVSHPETP